MDATTAQSTGVDRLERRHGLEESRGRREASKSYKRWSSGGSGAGLGEQLLNIQRQKKGRGSSWNRNEARSVAPQLFSTLLCWGWPSFEELSHTEIVCSRFQFVFVSKRQRELAFVDGCVCVRYTVGLKNQKKTLRRVPCFERQGPGPVASAAFRFPPVQSEKTTNSNSR